MKPCVSSTECMSPRLDKPLHWRHNGRDSVSNHQPHDCLLNRLFRCRSKKISKLRVSGLCEGNPPVPSNALNVSIWWCHHDYPRLLRWGLKFDLLILIGVHSESIVFKHSVQPCGIEYSHLYELLISINAIHEMIKNVISIDIKHKWAGCNWNKIWLHIKFN